MPSTAAATICPRAATGPPAIYHPRRPKAMKILTFIMDKEVIERILRHISEETTPLRVLPARSPLQLEIAEFGPLTTR